MLTNTERQQIVEEVNAGTYGIDEALDDIAAAQKGEEVRKALYAEALVLNREGHAGSTDMIARQQIANLQTSVNGQISTLRTEVGEDIDDLEEALNSGLATQNGRIAAQNATIANVVANYNVEYGSETLWEATGETGLLASGTTATLSKDVSNFDYIDIYSFCGNSNVLDTVPVDAKLQSSQGYALRWVNLSDPDSGSYKAYVRIIETRLHIIGTTLTIDHQVTYRNGEEVNISGAEITQSNRSTYMGELGIMKVVGRKITANTEIEDVRIGADGTEYESAGQAVRGQITEVKAQIPLIDASLATAGKAADAKAVGDELTDIRTGADGTVHQTAGSAVRGQIQAIEDELDTGLAEVNERLDDLEDISELFVISNNLFNKDDADIVLNSEIAANGTISEKSNYFVSGFIPVEYGKTYTLSYPSNNYGTNSRVVTYNANKERIGYRNASVRTTESPYWITFTADAQSASILNTDIAYVRYTGYTPNIDSYRFVEGTEYSEFMPYGKKQLASDVQITEENLGDDFKISPDNTTFIKVSSKNLLNIDAMVVGDLSNQAGSANVLPQNTGYLTTDFIPVESGKTYALYAPVFHYGVNNYRGVPCYNTSKEFVGYVLPNQTLVAEPLPCTITIPTGAAYIRNCYPKSQNNWKQKYYFVITESDTIPDGTYIPYQVEMKLIGAGIEDDYSEIYNPLIGKLAVWDGDSICAADNDALGGWPMRIGTANHMDVKSYAVSGATITSNTSASHWISASIDTIAEAYPNADYVVIDGGTNDADQLRDVEGGIGTFDANDFSAEYIAALDKNTFSGALEYVFYKMVTVWKGKHVGYIIPQKMGTGGAAVAGRILFFDRAREIATKWGIPVIDLWNNYYFNWKLTAHYDPSLTSDGNNEAGNLYRDGQHLTNTGYAIQSPVIAEWMKGI